MEPVVFQEPCIVDVFRKLDTSVLDAFVTILIQQGSVRSARRACRGLRDIIDDSMQEVTLKFEDPTRKKPGPGPSLTRWPRCTSIKLNLNNLVTRLYTAEFATLCMQPFEGLALEAKQRITRLAVQQDQLSSASKFEAAIMLLVKQLPALREVELHELQGLSYLTAPSLSMFDSMASLPHLERLTLRRLEHVKYIGALLKTTGINRKRSFKRLEVYYEYSKGGDRPDPAEFAPLLPLEGLLELRFVKCKFDSKQGHSGESGGGLGALPMLLHSLPASLRLLRLEQCHCLGVSIDMLQIRLDAFRVAGVDMELNRGNCSLILKQLSAVRRGLAVGLAWKPGEQQQGQREQEPLQQQREREQQQQQQLNRLSIVTLAIDGAAPLSEQQAEQLRGLLRAFPQVQVGTLLLTRGGCAAPLAAVRQAVEVLGEPREQVVLEVPVGSPSSTDSFIRLRVAVTRSTAARQQAPPPEAEEEAEERPAQPAGLQPLPSTAELMQAAVARMAAWPAAAGVTACEDVADRSEVAGGSGGDAAASSSSNSASLEHTPMFPPRASTKLMLLRGRLAAMLGGNSTLLGGFLRQVASHAGEADVEAIADSCVAPPLTDTLVLKSGWFDAKEVAERVAALLQDTGMAGSLQVLAVDSRFDVAAAGATAGALLALERALQQVVQEALDTAVSEAGDSGRLGTRPLDYLLRIRDDMREQPLVVWP